MNEIKEVCGCTDKSGKFWYTYDEALRANERMEEDRLKNKVSILLSEAFGWNYYHPRFIVDVDMGRLSEAMFNRPEKFLQILWEVTRYKFKKKFNDPTNKTGTE